MRFAKSAFRFLSASSLLLACSSQPSTTGDEPVEVGSDDTLSINACPVTGCPGTGTPLPKPQPAKPCAPYGLIGQKWNQRPDLGSCVEWEHDDGRGGRLQAFQHGYISWDGHSSQAYVVDGAIADKWREYGLAAFGRPLGDPGRSGDRIGVFSWFEGSKLILWSAATGPHAIYGDILRKWQELGSEFTPSGMGYPTSEEGDYKGKRVQYFQRGALLWSNGTTQVRTGSPLCLDDWTQGGADGACHPCGGDQQAACGGTECQSPHQSAFNGICQFNGSCGKLNAPCCEPKFGDPGWCYDGSHCNWVVFGDNMCRGNNPPPPPPPTTHPFCAAGEHVATYYVCMINTIGQYHEASIEACNGDQALATAQKNYIAETWFSLGHCQ